MHTVRGAVHALYKTSSEIRDAAVAYTDKQDFEAYKRGLYTPAILEGLYFLGCAAAPGEPDGMIGVTMGYAVIDLGARALVTRGFGKKEHIGEGLVGLVRAAMDTVLRSPGTSNYE